MDQVIRVKPHHFVDILTRFGAGEPFTPHPYGHAFHSVAERIIDDRDVTLQLDFGADDICDPCIHNVEGVCDDTIDTRYRPEAPAEKTAWNLLLDKRWCERLGLTEGGRLTARDLAERIRERAGDITDIYREIPADRTAARARKLEAGVDRFLD